MKFFQLWNSNHRGPMHPKPWVFCMVSSDNKVFFGLRQPSSETERHFVLFMGLVVITSAPFSWLRFPKVKQQRKTIAHRQTVSNFTA